MSQHYSKAIVIGGSIAGLAAAEVLSRMFEEVVVIERDHDTSGANFRKGVPQGRQPHALLKRGQIELDSLFPGFTENWIVAGAVEMQMGKNVRWHAFGAWRPNYNPALVCYGSSRPLLEAVIRSRVQANTKITFGEGLEVIGLMPDSTGKRVTGVHARRRGGKLIAENHDADLVVDASGRDTHTPQWLEALGYPCPAHTLLNAFPGYATRVYEWPSALMDKMIYIQPEPPHVKRGAVIMPLEDGRFNLCLIGMAKDSPPTDEEGFRAFLKSLPNNEIYNIVQVANPISEIYGYRRANNIWQHYERMSRWPEQFVAVGDSCLAFNPVYGQGMTTAIISARTLGQTLEAHKQTSTDLIGFAANFQKQLAKVQAFPWQLATGEDMRWSPTIETEGMPSRQSMVDALRGDFLKKVMIASTKDPVVTEVLYRVMNMIASPTEFFHPAMLVRVMRAA